MGLKLCRRRDKFSFPAVGSMISRGSMLDARLWALGRMPNTASPCGVRTNLKVTGLTFGKVRIFIRCVTAGD